MKINRNVFINISVVSFVAFAIAVLFSNLAYGASQLAFNTNLNKYNTNEHTYLRLRYNSKENYAEALRSDLNAWKKQQNDFVLEKNYCKSQCNGNESCDIITNPNDLTFSKEGSNGLKAVCGNSQTTNSEPKSEKTVISDSSESRTTNGKSEIKTEIKESVIEPKVISSTSKTDNNTQTANNNEYSIEQQLESYKSDYLNTVTPLIKAPKCDLDKVQSHGRAYLDNGVNNILDKVDISSTMKSMYLNQAKQTVKDNNDKCKSINTDSNNKQMNEELEKLKTGYLNETNDLIKNNKCETVTKTSTEYKNKVEHLLMNDTYYTDATKAQRENYKQEFSNLFNEQERKCQSSDEKKKCDEAGNLWKDNTCKKVGDLCTEKRGEGVGKYEKTAKGFRCKLTECKADGFYIDAKDDGYSCTKFEYKKQKTDDEKKADEYKTKMQELKQNYLDGLKDVVKSPSCNMETVKSRNKAYTDGHKRFSDLYGKYVSTEEQTKIKDDMDKTISDKTLECNTINCKKDGGTWKDNKCKLPGDDYDEDIKKVYESKIEGLLNKNCTVTKVNSTFDEYKKATNDFQTKYPKKTDAKKQQTRLKAIETLQKQTVDACNKIGKFKEAVQQVSNAYVQNLGRLKQQYDEEERKIAEAAQKAQQQAEQQSAKQQEKPKSEKETAETSQKTGKKKKA